MPTLLQRLRKALAPNYEVERELATGGMGSVFLAREPMLDRFVAIKILKPDLASPTAAERFQREARVLAQLKHPNIVPIHQAGEADGLSYYVMEYVEGETLAERLERGPLSNDEALTFAGDLLAALAVAHENGIVHRDVKPANIFLADGRAVLVDFGIAKRVEDSREQLTAPGHAVGTRAYMAPEQIVGENVSPATDVYASAVVLYEALHGERWSVLAPAEEADWTGVPRSLQAPIQRALAWSPKDRWPDASAFLEALTGGLAYAPSATRHARAKLLRRAFGFGVGVLGVFIVGQLNTLGDVRFSLPAFGGAWLTVIAGLGFLFDRAEGVISPNVRGTVARWLRNLDVHNWTQTFGRVFDLVFGRRHFSVDCFGRSCAASTFAVIVVWLIAFSLEPGELAGRLEMALTLSVFANFLPDYLSLLETRYIIRWMSAHTSNTRILTLLALDLVITTAIALASVLLLTAFLTPLLKTRGLMAIPSLMRDAPITLLRLASLSSEFAIGGQYWHQPLGILFYSTFFTSVWLWLYALAGAAVKLGPYLQPWVVRLISLLGIDSQPLRCMGFVAMLIVTLIFLIVLPFAAL